MTKGRSVTKLGFESAHIRVGTQESGEPQIQNLLDFDSLDQTLLDLTVSNATYFVFRLRSFAF
jgi:hypothetical protein